jgi:hypothetical protein
VPQAAQRTTRAPVSSNATGAAQTGQAT